MAQCRTHDLTKGLAYVSTQKSGQFDTFLFNHFSVHSSRRQLIPFFDKPAFSRIPWNLEPRTVVEIFGKFMLPKRIFWTAEPSFEYAFLKNFSISGSPKRVLTPLKSTSKTHTQRFVQPSKIFVWGAMWETTFPRNSHAGLGKDFTKISPYSPVC